MILTLESELIITLNGRVRVCEGMIMLTAKGGCELKLKPLPTMTFMYGDATLDIRGLGWRCVLYEVRDELRILRESKNRAGNWLVSRPKDSQP